MIIFSHVYINHNMYFVGYLEIFVVLVTLLLICLRPCLPFQSRGNRRHGYHPLIEMMQSMIN